MIELTNTHVVGWEDAIRGMRNPLNSWDRSDSEGAHVGNADLMLMQKLADSGSTHAKYRRMINVYCDITAPLYWWKEFDTYKVGTVANSCSTMHKISAKEFTVDDFSHSKLSPWGLLMLQETVEALNAARDAYIRTKNKQHWWDMIQLLPSSYNQKRTVMLNYEVLTHIYADRKNHKLDEWRVLCVWIETLPHAELMGVKEHATEE